ncbi:hypothetical protein GCM10009827_051190 [Dactylosporangium maewongense]|uniref:Uncharacterized protein n=1 Tax=Dactylosporangium maewongense TaxID=634393 RepID=A0ABP4LN29_9ACTN
MTGSDDLSWIRHRAVPARTGATEDLSWIRHRRLPATAAPAAASSVEMAAPAPSGSTSLDLSGPATPPPAPARDGGSTSLDLSGPAAPPQSGSTSLDLSGPAAPPAPPGNTSLDLSAPAAPPPPPSGSTSLDLSGPTPPPAAQSGGTSLDLSGPTPPPAARSGSTSLDLSGGGAPPPSVQHGGTSLDLSGPAAPRTPVPAAPPPATAFTPPRTNPSAPTVLGPRHPSVMLSRLQSGIGALTFEAAWSPDEGFALGCAFQLDSGTSSVLRPGETFGPLTMDRRAGHQRLRLDLLHGRHLRRLIIFGIPTADPGPYWAGTLLIGTHGHARVEVPVQPPPPGPTVLLSLYNVDGEIVLRAEAQTVPGRTRDACLAFGYDRIAWRDADTAIPPTA